MSYCLGVHTCNNRLYDARILSSLFLKDDSLGLVDILFTAFLNSSGDNVDSILNIHAPISSRKDARTTLSSTFLIGTIFCYLLILLIIVKLLTLLYFNFYTY